MPSAYHQLKQNLRDMPRHWLVTGGAGFIGSHLVEELLSLDQTVTCLDDLSSGRRENLAGILDTITDKQRARFHLIEGDAADLETCRSACEGVDRILHQAGIGSVPQSIADPAATHRVNVTGSVNLLAAAHAHGIRRIVFASSCAVYGDDPELPKTEASPTPILTPYAASKRVCEIYAEAFARSFGLEIVALRYFNVFGPRQDPGGAYAAVIPIWISAMLRGEPVAINGDGKNTRDFCFVGDVVQANLLAAMSRDLEAPCPIYNVASGQTVSLNELAALLREKVAAMRPGSEIPSPAYGDFRTSDIRHSSANIDQIRRELKFEPGHSLTEGLDLSMDWYAANPA